MNENNSFKYTPSQTEKELTGIVRAYLAKDKSGAYLIPEKDRIPVILMGPPGIGKTEIPAQIAKRSGIGFVSYNLSQHTRTSIAGLPKIVDDAEGGSHTENTKSELIAEVEKKVAQGFSEGILFLDEINSASETLSAVMLSLLQKKELGGYRLPEGWMMILAGNPTEYNRSAKKLDMATMDRVRIMEVCADEASFLKYARENDIHDDICGFIASTKASLYKYDTEHPMDIVTPRSWMNLSRTLKVNELLGLETDIKTIKQFIRSPGIAAAFCDYRKKAQGLLKRQEIEDILSGKRGAIKKAAEKCLLTESMQERKYMVENFMSGSVKLLEGMVEEYGYDSCVPAKAIKNIFSFLDEVEISKNGKRNSFFRQSFSEKLGRNKKLMKYANMHEVADFRVFLSEKYALAQR